MVAESQFASKHKSGVKGSGSAPMDLSTMNTGNTDSTETKQTKRNTCCGCSSVAAVVPEDVVAKDLVTKGKDSMTKDPVNHVATQEVAQVTKGRSGGSANVKANTIETDVLFKTNVERNDETTDSEDDFMSCCASETTDK